MRQETYLSNHICTIKSISHVPSWSMRLFLPFFISKYLSTPSQFLLGHSLTCFRQQDFYIICPVRVSFPGFFFLIIYRRHFTEIIKGWKATRNRSVNKQHTRKRLTTHAYNTGGFKQAIHSLHALFWMKY